MSQSEVERLLETVSDSDALGAGLGSGPGSGQDLIARHDFPQVSTFSAGDLRKLRMRCESFVSSLAARLSLHLRLECALQMTKLDTIRFHPFIDSLSNPTYLTLFRIDPLEGVCLLDMPARLGLAIVDRELGGPAVCQDEIRDLTQMEAKLAAKVVNVILAEWCNTWADTHPMRPVLLRHETSGRFLNLSSTETVFLCMSLEVKLAQTVETIQIAFPQAALEPLLAKLNSDLQPGQKPHQGQNGASAAWNPAFNDVRIQVTARWRGLEISARQLAALKPGDLLPLRPAATSQVEISLESLPKFTGQLGTSGQRLAVKIVETLAQI
jgi:flagellar motor switch protein FliM